MAHSSHGRGLMFGDVVVASHDLPKGINELILKGCRLSPGDDSHKYSKHLSDTEVTPLLAQDDRRRFPVDVSQHQHV